MLSTMKLRYPICLALVAGVMAPGLMRGQWDDVTEMFAIEASTQASFLGTGMSVADFNSDGLEDLTFGNSDGTVAIYVQLASGGFQLEYMLEGEAQPQGVVWFDADGDEDLDLMITRRFASIELYVQEDGLLTESAAAAGIPTDDTWEARGIAVADYDVDGDLDVYISMYHDGTTGLSENLLLNNDGAGQFVNVTNAAGVGNGLKHTFQSVWLDLNEDDLLDLWVINDRSVYPNAAYMNLGDGTFADVSMDWGLAQTLWAMTATAGDPDNDGVQELFCSSVENDPNVFLDNTSGTYSDVGPEVALNGLQYSWGGCWVDADGDMWSDLMVATYRFPNTLPYDNYFYRNTQNGTYFEDQAEQFWTNEQTQLYALGVLDWNQDMAPDVVGFGNMPFAQMLENAFVSEEGVSGRLVVQLCGTASNRWAIGSEIRVHTGDVTQTQWVNCGEDFMTQQSWKSYFGLGTATAVDSVEVFWPGGGYDVWYDVEANSELRLVEGSSTAELVATGEGCANDSSWLVFPLDCPERYLNGTLIVGDSVLLETAGTYVLECEWMGGLFQWSDTLEYAPSAPHIMTIEWTEPDCYGEFGILGWVTSPDLMVHYEGGSYPSFVQNVAQLAGPLMLESVDSTGGCLTPHHFNLSEPSELQVYIEYFPALCAGDSASAFAAGYGGTPGYLVNWNDVDPNNLPQGEVLLTIEDAHGCTLDSSIQVVIPDPLECEVTVIPEDLGDDGALLLDLSGGTLPYEILWNTGQAGDTALYGLGQGLYSWVVLDAQGCTLLGVQDLFNLHVDPTSDEDAWTVNRGPNGIWLNAGTSWPEGVAVSVFDAQGRAVSEFTMAKGDAFFWAWDQVPFQGIIWVHDERGRTYLRSAY